MCSKTPLSPLGLVKPKSSRSLKLNILPSTSVKTYLVPEARLPIAAISANNWVIKNLLDAGSTCNSLIMSTRSISSFLVLLPCS